MLDEHWKRFLEQFKFKIAYRVPLWLSANDISLIGLGLSLLGCLANAFGFRNWAFILILFSIISDGIDGGVARLRNQASDYGGYLDITTDFFCYCFYPLSEAVLQDNRAIYIALGFLLSSYAINVCSAIWLMALIEKRKATKTIAILPTGNLCEADTTYIFMLLVWLVPRIATYLFFGYSGLVFLGIVLRTLFIKKYYSSEIQEK